MKNLLFALLFTLPFAASASKPLGYDYNVYIGFDAGRSFSSHYRTEAKSFTIPASADPIEEVKYLSSKFEMKSPRVFEVFAGYVFSNFIGFEGEAAYMHFYDLLESTEGPGKASVNKIDRTQLTLLSNVQLFVPASFLPLRPHIGFGFGSANIRLKITETANEEGIIPFKNWSKARNVFIFQSIIGCDLLFFPHLPISVGYKRVYFSDTTLKDQFREISIKDNSMNIAFVSLKLAF